jgi:hypothetical protein
LRKSTDVFEDTSQQLGFLRETSRQFLPPGGCVAAQKYAFKADLDFLIQLISD